VASDTPDLFDKQSSVRQSRTSKSATAYRTISEVADELRLAPHVLRFWETRFKQLTPLKRQGGRRFYRPQDIALLRRIKVLLYDEGYTIRGVQAYLKKNAKKDDQLQEDHILATRQLVKELQTIRTLLA
jgi:DNA-binding transcriptional MerR regulator